MALWARTWSKWRHRIQWPNHLTCNSKWHLHNTKQLEIHIQHLLGNNSYHKKKSKTWCMKNSRRTIIMSGKVTQYKITRPSMWDLSHLRRWICNQPDKKVTKRKVWVVWVTVARTATTQRKLLKPHSIRNTKLRTSVKKTQQVGLIRALISFRASLCKLKVINCHPYRNQRSHHTQKGSPSFKTRITCTVWKRVTRSKEDLWDPCKTTSLKISRELRTLSTSRA